MTTPSEPGPVWPDSTGAWDSAPRTRSDASGGSAFPSPDAGYVPPDQASPADGAGENYAQRGYPAASYPATGYPAQAYPSTGYADAGYPAQAYPAQVYPAPAQTAAGYGGYAGYAGYGAQPMGGYYPYTGLARKTNSLSIASMVISIVGMSMVFCYGIGGVVGIVGAILGHVGRRQIRDRQEGGDGMALAGIIVGWIATAMGTIIVGAIAFAFAVAG